MSDAEGEWSGVLPSRGEAGAEKVAEARFGRSREVRDGDGGRGVGGRL